MTPATSVESEEHRTYSTVNRRLETWSERIREKYNRAPTIQELLAIGSFPCLPLAQLFDSSETGNIIYECLCHAEKTGNPSTLEEAGRLLMWQASKAWRPTTTIEGDLEKCGGGGTSTVEPWNRTMTGESLSSSDRNNNTNVNGGIKSAFPSSARAADLNKPQDFFSHPSPTPHLCAGSTTTGLSGAASLCPTPFNSASSTASHTSTLPLRVSPTHPSNPVLQAHSIDSNTYITPLTIPLANTVSNSSIAVHVPSTASATYPLDLVSGERKRVLSRRRVEHQEAVPRV